jgi:hypothetical protein
VPTTKAQPVLKPPLQPSPAAVLLLLLLPAGQRSSALLLLLLSLYLLLQLFFCQLIKKVDFFRARLDTTEEGGLRALGTVRSCTSSGCTGNERAGGCELYSVSVGCWTAG